MLSAHDAGLIHRDRDLPGLAVLLDSDAFLELLAVEFAFLGAARAAIRYVRYKPHTSCLCSYRVTGPDGPFDAYAKAFTKRTPEKLRYWRTGASAEQNRQSGRAASDRWQIGISLFPDDRRLKVLPRLHDQARRERILTDALGSRPEWWDSALLTLRYKPERRYVAGLIEDGTPAAVLKFYTGTAYVQARSRAALFQSREVLRIPSLAGESARHRVLAFEWVSGRPLGEEIAASCDGAYVAGRALAELHAQDVSARLDAPDAAAARAVQAATESVAVVYPHLAARARALSDSIRAALDDRTRALRPAHGDFYADQVVLTGDAAAVLDFDRACFAHQAADLGTFAAHLRCDALRGRYSREHAEAGVQALLAGYSLRWPMLARGDVDVYTAAALVRLAPEPFRLRESQAPELTEAILQQAQECLTPPAEHVRHLPPAASAEPDIPVDDAPGISRVPEWSFLRPALDPSEARRGLDVPIARLGAERGQLRAIRVTRYKPGRRCIVEYEIEAEADESGTRSVVLIGKSRLKGLNGNANFALEALWNGGFNPSRSSVCVPQPLGSVPPWRMTLQRKVPGVPASDRLTGSDGVRVATHIAEAIHTLHSRGTIPARQHTLADELRILHDRLPKVSRQPARVERLLQQCDRLASVVPHGETRAIHRDFYPAHVLLDGERLWLIDLDLYCAGDPALDVGNFLAHMIEERLRREGSAEGLADAEGAFESRYAQLAGRRVLRAIRAYTTLSLVRHVYLSTQYSERQHTTEALIDVCERRLSATLKSRIYA